MNTGRVEYSPDYKSKRKPRVILVSPESIKVERKRNRLRDEVMEAAKFWRQEHEEQQAIYCSTSTRRLRKAVDALLSFEAEQK